MVGVPRVAAGGTVANLEYTSSETAKKMNARVERFSDVSSKN